jgi:hypothetical protein
MIALLRPQPNARSVGQPEPAALGLLMGDLQPLTLPDTLDPLVVDCPARLAQQRGDLAIAIAAVVPNTINKQGWCERVKELGTKAFSWGWLFEEGELEPDWTQGWGKGEEGKFGPIIGAPEIDWTGEGIKFDSALKAVPDWERSQQEE